MDLGLRDRVAIVTGASQGIGLATTKLLIQEEARVVGVSRRPPGEQLPGLAHVQADILDPETPTKAVECAVSGFGRLDVLVNNAGTVVTSTGSGRVRAGYDRPSAADWREAWEMFFLATVRMTNAALPHLLSGGGGVVVNVSSRNARVPVSAVPDYSAAKAALTNYSKGLAGQYARRGLRVVSVSPGPTSTPAWLGPGGVADQNAAMGFRGTDRDAVIRATEEAIPAGRLIKPEEVANLIVYLASPRASMITGVDILIDGGMTQTI